MLLRHAPKQKAVAIEMRRGGASDVPALLVECQHVVVLSVRSEPALFEALFSVLFRKTAADTLY